MASHPIHLVKADSGEAIEAELVEAIEESHLQAVETRWKPIIRRRQQELVDQNRPRSEWLQNAHWDWRKKVERVRGAVVFRSFSLVCEGELQGLMQLTTAGRSRCPGQLGHELVYVDYVEAAPWNRRDIVSDRRFNGVGSVLIIAAIAVSEEECFRGRIGLHSLPRAEPFYADRCGMTDLGIDGGYQNLKYFEMTPDQAAAFLR